MKINPPKCNLCSIIVLFGGFSHSDFNISRKKEVENKINCQRHKNFYKSISLNDKEFFDSTPECKGMNNEKAKKSNFQFQEVLLPLSTPNDECCDCTQKSHFNHIFSLNCGVAVFLVVFAWKFVGFLMWFRLFSNQIVAFSSFVWYKVGWYSKRGRKTLEDLINKALQLKHWQLHYDREKKLWHADNITWYYLWI